MKENFKDITNTQYILYRLYNLVIFLTLVITLSILSIQYLNAETNWLLNTSSLDAFYKQIAIGISILFGMVFIDIIIGYVFSFDALLFPIKRRKRWGAKNRRVYLIPSDDTDINIAAVDINKKEIIAVGRINKNYTFDIQDVEFQEGKTIELLKLTDDEMNCSTYSEIIEKRKQSNIRKEVK